MVDKRTNFGDTKHRGGAMERLQSALWGINLGFLAAFHQSISVIRKNIQKRQTLRHDKTQFKEVLL